MSEQMDKLRMIRADIAAGVPLVYDDCTETGNKFTTCSWGLCRFQSPHGLCPMDKRPGSHKLGCFHHCRVFQGGGLMNKRTALKLYGAAITKEAKDVE